MILLAIIIGPILHPYVDPDIQLIQTYSSMTSNVYVVLLIAFAGVYIAILTVGRKTTTANTKVDTLVDEKGDEPQTERVEEIANSNEIHEPTETEIDMVFGRGARMEAMRGILNTVQYPLIGTSLFIILATNLLVFFSKWLAGNGTLATVILFLILEITLVSGWIFVIFVGKMIRRIPTGIGGAA
jgi:hypothetical protein